MKNKLSYIKVFTITVRCGFMWLLTPIAGAIQLLGFIPSVCIRILYKLRRFLFLFYFLFAFIGYVIPKANELKMPIADFLKSYFLTGAFLTDSKGGTALLFSFIGVIIIRLMINLLLLLAEWLDEHTNLLLRCIDVISALHAVRSGLLLELSFADYVDYELSVMAEFRKKYPELVKNVPERVSS